MIIVFPRRQHPASICRRRRVVPAAVLLAIMVTGHAFGAAGLGDPAYSLLTERVTANRTGFFVYQDADAGFNHGFPSGFFGAVGKLHIDTGCLDDSGAANGCAADGSTRLDRVRGTVLRISFDPLTPAEFAGVNVEEPANWGERRTGRGYDLRGATHVVLDVRSPTPAGVRVQFGVGGGTTAFIHVAQSAAYTTLSIPLSSLTPLPSLADVHILFSVATNGDNAPAGGTLLLDNIRFEPVPRAQQDALSFPLGTQTFGVVPRQSPAPGRVPFPPDQVLRNLTTTYESSLTLLALLGRGAPTDVSAARTLADALDSAIHHDNHGDPLPPAPDGSVGLHNGYSSGDLSLFNAQAPPAAGQQGDVRLAGFSCGISPTGFCLVLDGATGGNNAFAILALVQAYRQLGDPRYLDAARTIGRWIVANLTDASGTGFGGYFLGYPDGGAVLKVLVRSKSTENNADLFVAFARLAAIERALGHGAAADDWTQRATVAGDFVMRMFDAGQGRFRAGTVPAGTPASEGITPTGATQGSDVINTFDFIDSNTFTTLALAAAPRYRDQIDWRRPIQFALDNFAQSVTVGGQTFHGFNIVKHPTAGPNGVAWEFTGQMVVAMQFVDRLYHECRFSQAAALYLDQIRHAVLAAPFGDGRGLVASTLQDGDTVAPIEQCLSTPFQCIPERVGLAATTWAVFAESGTNPLADPADLPAVAVTAAPSVVRSGNTLTLGLNASNPGPAFMADFYLGVVPPGATTACFFTRLSPLNATCVPLDGDPRTFPPLAPNVLVATGLHVTLPQLLSYTFSGGEPVGTYSLFAVLTAPGAFLDGRVETCDLLSLSLSPATFSP